MNLYLNWPLFLVYFQIIKESVWVILENVTITNMCFQVTFHFTYYLSSAKSFLGVCWNFLQNNSSSVLHFLLRNMWINWGVFLQDNNLCSLESVFYVLEVVSLYYISFSSVIPFCFEQNKDSVRDLWSLGIAFTFSSVAKIFYILS